MRILRSAVVPFLQFSTLGIVSCVTLHTMRGLRTSRKRGLRQTALRVRLPLNGSLSIGRPLVTCTRRASWLGFLRKEIGQVRRLRGNEINDASRIYCGPAKEVAYGSGHRHARVRLVTRP